MEILGWIITGGVAAAGVKFIETVSLWHLNRKASKEDDVANRHQDRHKAVLNDLTQTQTRVKNLTIGQRVILQDRIKYLGKSYIKKQAIDLEDREDLIEMHKVYHDYLDGNGNLDALMKDVLKLPLSDLK